MFSSILIYLIGIRNKLNWIELNIEKRPKNVQMAKSFLFLVNFSKKAKLPLMATLLLNNPVVYFTFLKCFLDSNSVYSTDYNCAIFAISCSPAQHHIYVTIDKGWLTSKKNIRPAWGLEYFMLKSQFVYILKWFLCYKIKRPLHRVNGRRQFTQKIVLFLPFFRSIAITRYWWQLSFQSSWF